MLPWKDRTDARNVDSQKIPAGIRPLHRVFDCPEYAAWSKVGSVRLYWSRSVKRRKESLVKMRAAVLEQFDQPLVVQEVDLADPRRGEVLVRLAACGVCHTDMYTASGVDPSGYAPTVLGHEGAGVVETVGEGVTSVKPGDHVITLFSPQCRECEHCLSPKTNLCLAIREQQNKG